eukprot:7312126-Prymnesium_polylepis.1
MSGHESAVYCHMQYCRSTLRCALIFYALRILRTPHRTRAHRAACSMALSSMRSGGVRPVAP